MIFSVHHLFLLRKEWYKILLLFQKWNVTQPLQYCLLTQYAAVITDYTTRPERIMGQRDFIITMDGLESLQDQ